MKYLSFFFLMIFAFVCGDQEINAQSASDNPVEKYYSSLEYRSIGPYRGGRSCAVTGVPGKPDLFYFGATGGGIWKTTDGGRSWENISDGFFGGSIGSIAVAQSDPNVIYVGGGEKTVRGNVSYGYGLWKTIDGGKNWTHIGLKDSRHVSRVRIDPHNADIAYAAVMGNLYAPHAERGVFKTTNGGKTWDKVLYINDEVGVVDLVIDPNNRRNLFASSWRVKRTPYSLESGGQGSGLWKSTDSGETWTEITGNDGLPEGTWGISGIAVSPVNSDRIWTIIENDKGGVYRSDDGGDTWKKTNDSRALRQRAWYYTRIYADTHDADKVYVVNVAYHSSTDGGKTFEPSRAPHGDHHDLWIAPEDPNRMIIGDDGGAQVTYDGGATWSTYHNQPTAQFYRVTTDNAFPYRIYVAQQDNSTIRINHRSKGRVIDESDWESTAGGESAHIAVDPDDNDIVYGGSYGGYLTRQDHKLDVNRAINVYPDNPMGHGAEGMKYRFQWNFPIFFSPHDSDRLYTGSNHLHLSTNEGQSWSIISPDLTRAEPEKLVSSGGPITKDNTGVEYYATIFAAAESPAEEGVIWAGSDDGLLHVTRDGGENWTDVTPTGAPKYLMYNSVDPDPRDAGTCYVAGTLYKGGDFRPYIYKTDDYGATWRKITNGIPDDHFTRVVRVDPNKEGLLYAGTETGMYISYDDGQSWHSFQLNLPIVPITDLTIKDNNLIVATQGRSIWMIDDLTVIHQVLEEQSDFDYGLYAPMDSYRYGGGQSANAKGVGQNHPSGVMTHFYLSQYEEGQDTVSLSYADPSGEVIKTYSTHADDKDLKLSDLKSGGNMFNWDMKYDDATDFEGMIMWWGSMAGAKAAPGSYNVTLTVNGQEMSEDFTILGDPRLGLTDADYQSQFSFINEINSAVSESHEAIIEIREVNDQVKKYKDIIADDEEITQLIGEIDSTLQSVETGLYQTKNRSRQDPLNFPIRLTNKLAHLNSLAQIGDYPPTDQAIEVKDVLMKEIDALLEVYDKVKSGSIPQLNNLIRQRALDYIIIGDDEDE